MSKIFTNTLAVTLFYIATASAQQTSTWSIIRDKILAPNCTSCHYEGSSFARQSGLVLTPDVAYSQLVDRQPQNATARDDGLLRVGTKGLESLGTSYLWEKIDARNQEHFYSDHPFYGALMPLGGGPLTNGELELIKRWIVGGAPENIAIAGADESLLADTTRFENPPFAPLPVPEKGIQLQLGPFNVAPNYERESLFYEPLNLADDIFIKQFEMVMRPGSHHFILYAFSKNTPGSLVPQPHTFRDYRDANGFYIFPNLAITRYHIFFAGTQWPRVNYHFPEGVALRLPKGLGLDLNSHYANRTNEIVTGEVYANLHTVDRSEVEFVAEVLFLNNTDFYLPPNQVTTITKTYPNNANVNMNIFQLFSHAHEHMMEFRVELAGGPRDGELVYISTDWQHPPILELDPPLIIAPGDGLRLIATYNNWTNRGLTFGLLSQDEMMILFGYDYLGNFPTDVAEGDEAKVPSAYTLEQNYPNPFNPSTTIVYRLPERSNVRLEIFDVTGKSVGLLFDGQQQAGSHRIVWDAAKKPAGMYLVKMQAGEFIAVRKLMLLR
jgi:hypothetical protein